MPEEWKSEPDRLEWEAHGLKCVIIRHRDFGHLCGYVGLPAIHPLDGIGYNTPTPALVAAWQKRLEKPVNGDIGIVSLFCATHDTDEERARMDLALAVHGGVTYSGDHLHGYEGKDLWWIGFDCSHSGDIAPGMVERYPQWGNIGVYRNIAYVAAQTENLARQLAEIATYKSTEEVSECPASLT